MTEDIARMIGLEAPERVFCDPVEPGAVRRYAQAIGDLDPAYIASDAATRFREPVAPPLYPLAMLRLPFGAPDLVDQRAGDDEYDGATELATYGLPPLPLDNSPIVNGGVDVELHRYVRHGEIVRMRARYKDIYEKETSKGSFIFVVYEVTYLDEKGGTILTLNRTQIRR